MKLNSSLMLANMNTRVEKAGDKPGRGALTLKFDGTMSRDQVKMLFSTESSYKRLLAHIWDKEGELTTSDIRDMPLTVGIVGGSAIISSLNEKHSFDAVKVDSVSVTPMPGFQCEVTCKIACYPDKDSLWFLFQHQSLSLELLATPGQMSIEDGIESSRDAEDKERPADGDLPLGDGDGSASADSPFAGLEVE